jgi:hypothetical protein
MQNDAGRLPVKDTTFWPASLREVVAHLYGTDTDPEAFTALFKLPNFTTLKIVSQKTTVITWKRSNGQLVKSVEPAWPEILQKSFSGF